MRIFWNGGARSNGAVIASFQQSFYYHFMDFVVTSMAKMRSRTGIDVN